jgi:hypothetical protein
MTFPSLRVVVRGTLAALIILGEAPMALRPAMSAEGWTSRETLVQSDDRTRSLQRQVQYAATLQSLRALEAMLASATLDDEARSHMHAQLDSLVKHYEASNPAELKIARLKLEMKDLRDKQGGAISGGNLESFADQEGKLRRRELEILLEIRELEKQIRPPR